jgi:hypothetical protein
MNLKATRNIPHKLRQSVCSYLLKVIGSVHESHTVYMAAECQDCEMAETGSDVIPMLEHFLLNSDQFSLRQQHMLNRK